MQKNKTARKGKASQPVNHACPKKTAKVCRQKSSKKTRARKPLTPEQRERKNARDRRRRAAKRGVSVSPLLIAERSRTSASCSRCTPDCSNYQTCTRLSQTDNLPKLHAVKPALVPVGQKEPVRKPDALAAIDAFICNTLSQMTAENRNGIVRRHFELPDGIAEVAVCRKVCEVPRVSNDIAGIADRSWSALAEQCVAYLLRKGAGITMGTRTGVTKDMSQLESDVDQIVDVQHGAGCTWFGDDCK